MKFKTEVVLSVTTGVLLCKMDEIYDILNYMLDTSLITTALPLAARLVKPRILEKYPELDVDVSNIKEYLVKGQEEESIRQYLGGFNLATEYEMEQITP